ncbi:MAG: type II secretion system protein [Candidatus Komeilibacteria bacterium]
MKNNKGFTLIELLVVIAIIGLLSTLAVVSLNSARSKARDARRTSDIRQLQTALEMYFNDKGAYPATPSNSTYLGEDTTGTDDPRVLTSAGFEETGTAGETVFMNQVPSDPQPDTYHYDYAATGTGNTGYTISFTLENDNSSWGGDVCVASPGQISCN